jgi:hypothetical protein
LSSDPRLSRTHRASLFLARSLRQCRSRGRSSSSKAVSTLTSATVRVTNPRARTCLPRRRRRRRLPPFPPLSPDRNPTLSSLPQTREHPLRRATAVRATRLLPLTRAPCRSTRPPTPRLSPRNDPRRENPLPEGPFPLIGLAKESPGLKRRHRLAPRRPNPHPSSRLLSIPVRSPRRPTRLVRRPCPSPVRLHRRPRRQRGSRTASRRL